MTAAEAISYCLRHVLPGETEDGEIWTASVKDRRGDKHWIAWFSGHGDEAIPELCSESYGQFTKALEPYEAIEE